MRLSRAIPLLVTAAALLLGAGAARARGQEPLDAVVTLEIVDDDLAPIEGAKVVAEYEPEGHSYARRVSARGTTDERGIVVLDLTPGIEHFIVIDAPGDSAPRRPPTHEVRVEPIEAGGGLERTVRLTNDTALTLHTRIVDQGGAPIDEATARVIEIRSVGISGRALDARPEEFDARSDADGVVTVGISRERETGLVVHAPGYAPRLVEVDARSDRSSADDPTPMALEEAGLLEVHLLGAPDGTTVWVEGRLGILTPSNALGPARSYGGGVRFEPRLEDGVLAFDDLPPGRMLMLIADTGDRARRVVRAICGPAPGVTRRLVVDLARSRKITGVLVDEDGSPLTNVDVGLASESKYGIQRAGEVRDEIAVSTTDASGRFAFVSLAPARYRVGLRDRRQIEGHAVAVEMVDARTSTESATVRLVAYRGRELRVEAVPPPGYPPLGFLAALHVDRDHLVVDETPPREGAAVMGPVLPGPYRISAYSSKGPSTVHTSFIAEAIEGEGENRRVEMQECGSFVATLFHGEGRQDWSEGGVSLESLDLPMLAYTRGGPGAAHVEIPDLQPGRYAVTAIGPGGLVGAAGEVTIRSGRRTAITRLDLEPGARLRVSCDDDVGWVRATFRGEAGVVRVAQFGSARSSTTFMTPGHADVVLPPGAVTVTLERLERAGEVTAMAEATVDALTEVPLRFGDD